ncbi:hypothetical protein [Heyndrickxia vini]|uniref:Uncharacterized protein n=1 Tax=Heyndrickxia vini TaxID=1476025 RepID=A0ABX7E017_9BACI|nr:hypothetical protein [Heyndrickxia vini]QQZ08931.1 hypothetical protein I5776_18235 [Heyndrickxia vini]
MIILYLSVIIFNFLALYTNKRLTGSQVLHIWSFTITFQLMFDVFIDLKYKGYWYFTQGIDWVGLPAYTILIPPVNVIFLNWFPYGSSLIKRVGYFVVWEFFLLLYEMIAKLPEPWGYFRYGWWNIWYSFCINPLLLCTVLLYYKWVLRLERKTLNNV